MIRPGLWRREFSAPLVVLQNELNRIFDDYWQPVGSPFRPGRPEASSHAAATDVDPADWTPAIDVDETGDEYLLSVDLPGVDPSSIDLSVSGDVLTLRGEKSTARPVGGSSVTRERATGTFSRQLNLVDVDLDNIQAEARHGVLYVRIPRRRTVQPRTIKVQHS